MKSTAIHLFRSDAASQAGVRAEGQRAVGPLAVGLRWLNRFGWARIVLAAVTAYALYWLAAQPEVSEIRPHPDRAPLLLADPKPAPDDWPGYRGPGQQGHLRLPLDWLTTVNAPLASQWQQGIPTAVGSPCAWGTRLFVISADQATGHLLLSGHHRDTGDRLWQLALPGDDAAPVTPPRWKQLADELLTPACDGRYVFVPSIRKGQLRLNAVTLDGELAWSQVVGPYAEAWPYRISPVIAGSLVVLAVDQESSPARFWCPRSYLSAVHRLTGELVWRTRRPAGTSAGVPVAAQLAGRPQLVVPGKGRICSYDPATGEELWHCKWLADRVLGSVVTDDRHVYMTTAEPHGNILCIRADGKGDVSSTHLVWRSLLPDGAWGTLALAPPYLIHQQFDGTILALDSASGRNLWRVRTPGRLSHPPLIADRQLLTIDDRGGVHLLDVDRRGEGLLELNVPAGASQSLVIGNSSLLLRSPLGLSHLRGSSASQVAIEPRTSPRQQ